MVPETAPKLAQVLPSVEYCQVPLPVTAVIAIPLRAGVDVRSAGSGEDGRSECADEFVSSLVPVSVKLCPLVIVGASLTLVRLTVIV